MTTLSYVLKNLLLPGYSNNQKAKIIHNESIFLLILVLVMGQVLINFFPDLGLKILGYASQISTDEVIRLTNDKRSSSGMTNLTYNPLLAAAAKAKGEDMLAKDYWAHVAPDGTQPWKFFNDVGYKYKYAGENLAKDFSNPQAAVDAWMASPSHKDNLLSANYDEIGVAVVEGDVNGTDTTIIIQLFGKRYNTNIASATTTVSAKTETQVNTQPQITSIPKPTLIPTFTPTPLPTDVIAPTGIILETNEKTSGNPTPFQVLISPFSTKKGFSAATTSILLLTFAVDAIYLKKRKFSRVGGRTFAHIIFLGMILTIIIFVQSGELLPPISDYLK